MFTNFDGHLSTFSVTHVWETDSKDGRLQEQLGEKNKKENKRRKKN